MIPSTDPWKRETRKENRTEEESYRFSEEKDFDSLEQTELKRKTGRQVTYRLLRSELGLGDSHQEEPEEEEEKKKKKKKKGILKFQKSALFFP